MAKSKSNDDRPEWYIPYSTVPYPQKQHPSIAGQFWSCACTQDVSVEDKLILCGSCKNTLSHKICMSVKPGDVFQCPRCKYYVNWKEEEQDEDREWTDEDDIRLIVLCSEGLSRHTISKSLNKPLNEVSEAIEELVDEGKLRYNGKKTKEMKRRSNGYSKKEINLISEPKTSAIKKKQLHYWTEDEDEKLLGLMDIRSSHVPISMFRQIVSKFNQNAETERSAGALQNRHRLLMKRTIRKEKHIKNDTCESDEYFEEVDTENESNSNNKKRKIEQIRTMTVNTNSKKQKLNVIKPINSNTATCGTFEFVEERVNMTVGLWLRNEVNLPQYLDIFIREGYDDMDTIVYTMTDDDLEGIGIKKRGHRSKIMLFVQRLRENDV